MPRPARRKPLLYHDQCLGLDVIELARRGYLGPGHHAGELEILVIGGGDRGLSAGFRGLFGPDEGVFRVSGPAEQDIRARPVGTGIGPRWRLACPGCGSLVRRLFLPPSSRSDGHRWACRLCWDISYRPGGRREAMRSAREELAEVRRIRAGLDALEKVIEWRLREWEEGRAADAT